MYTLGERLNMKEKKILIKINYCKHCGRYWKSVYRKYPAVDCPACRRRTGVMVYEHTIFC